MDHGKMTGMDGMDGMGMDASTTARSPVNITAANNRSSHSSTDSNAGMWSAFHFGSLETILFDFWNINSTTGVAVSWALIFLASIGYEALKWFRLYLGKNYKSHSYTESVMPVGTEPKSVNIRIKKYLKLMRFVHTTLNALQLLLGYMFMLVFMTLNVWLCSAVIIGDAVGYFIFVGGPNGDDKENSCA